MAKYAELSDGTRLEFPDNTEDSVIDATVKKHLSLATPEEPEKNSSDFMRGLGNYIPGMKEIGRGAEVGAGLLAKNIGAEQTGKELIQSGIQGMNIAKSQQINKDTDSFTNAWDKGISSVLTDYLPYQMGAGVGSIGESLAAAGVGAAIGSAIGPEGAVPGALAGLLEKSLVKTGVRAMAEKIAKEQGEDVAEQYVKKEAGKIVGGIAGTAAQAGVHGVGEVTGRAVDELKKPGMTPEETQAAVENIDISRLAPAMLTHGAADFVAKKIGLNAIGGLSKAATGNIYKDILKTVAATGAKEILPEEIQSIAERYGAKLSLSDADAFKEYIDTAASSVAMSVAPGAIGGAKASQQAQTAIAKQKADQKAEEYRLAAEQQAKEIENKKIEEAITASGGQTSLPNLFDYTGKAPVTEEDVKDISEKTAAEYLHGLDARFTNPSQIKTALKDTEFEKLGAKKVLDVYKSLPTQEDLFGAEGDLNQNITNAADIKQARQDKIASEYQAKMEKAKEGENLDIFGAPKQPSYTPEEIVAEEKTPEKPANLMMQDILNKADQENQIEKANRLREQSYVTPEGNALTPEQYQARVEAEPFKQHALDIQEAQLKAQHEAQQQQNAQEMQDKLAKVKSGENLDIFGEPSAPKAAQETIAPVEQPSQGGSANLQIQEAIKQAEKDFDIEKANRLREQSYVTPEGNVLTPEQYQAHDDSEFFKQRASELQQEAKDKQAIEKQAKQKVINDALIAHDAKATKDTITTINTLAKELGLKGDLKSKVDQLRNVDVTKDQTENKYSVADTATGTGHTADSLSKGLSPEMKALVSSGKAVIHDTAATLPGENHPANVQGMTTKEGITHYVANKLTPKTLDDLAVHEVGVHVGMEKMVGPKVWKDITNQVMSNKGAVYEKARASVPKDTPENLKAEETLAYLVEHSPNLPLVRRLISSIRNWVRTRFGANIKLTEDDARHLAVSVLRKESKRPTQTMRKESVYSKTKLLAPNGKPSNLNAVQYAQVRTPEFKKWFGDWENDPKNASKVVDENGEPLVVYHVTGTDFNAFDNKFLGVNTGAPSALEGFFFTDSSKVAAEYAKPSKEDMLKGDKLAINHPFDLLFAPSDKGHTFTSTFIEDEPHGESVYYENRFTVSPFVHDDSGVHTTLKVEYFNSYGDMDEDTFELSARSIDSLVHKIDDNKILKGSVRRMQGYSARTIPVFLSLQHPGMFDYEGKARSRQYSELLPYFKQQFLDGGVFKNTFDSGREKRIESNIYVAFHPNQIKSAIGNTGAFNKSNTDIRYSVAPKNDADLRAATQVYATPEAKKEPSIFDKATGAGKYISDTPLNNILDDFKAGVDKFRTTVAHSGSPIERWYQQKYNGVMRDALTNEIRGDILYDQAIASKNQAVATLEQGKPIIEDGVVRIQKDDNNVDNMFKLLNKFGDRIGSIDDAKHAASAYLQALRYQHTLTKNAELQKKIDGVTDEKKAKKLEEKLIKVSPEQEAGISSGLEYGVRHPEVKKIADMWMAIKNNVVDFQEKTGHISKETAEMYRKDPAYVPLYRLMDDLENTNPGYRASAKSIAGVKAEKHFEGSERDVKDIFDNMVHRVMWGVESGIKNFANQRIAKDLGIQNEDGEVIYHKTQPVGKSDTTAPIWIDGKQRWVEYTDPSFATALNGIDPIIHSWIKLFGKSSKILRMSVTSLPMFQALQIVYDAQRAAVYSGVDHPFKLMGNILKNAGQLYYDMLKGRENAIIKEMERAGVHGGYAHTVEEISDAMHRKYNLEANTKVKQLLDKIDKIASVSDMAQRKAIYEQTIKETGDKVLAEHRARNIINWNRHGSSESVRVLTQIVPFMNAYIQSMDVLLNTINGTGISTKEKSIARNEFKRIGMQLALLSFVYSMAVGDDDEYQKMNDREKISNLVIPGIGMVPVASEVGFMFKALPEMLYQYFSREGTKNPMDSTKLKKALWNSFANAVLGPNAMPQAIKPIIEATANHSFLTGTELIGPHLKNLETSLQFNENTSELGKLMGRSGLISPIIADHIMKAYGGTVASLTLMSIDSILDAFSDVKRPTQALHKNPIIGKYVIDSRYKDQVDSYYDLLNKSNEVASSLKEYKDTGNSTEAKNYQVENKEMLKTRSQVLSLQTRMTMLREQHKKIVNSPKLSGDEKKEKLDQLEERIGKTLKNINLLRVKSGM